MNSSLSMIVAMAENNVIGKDGKIPWKIPADLNLFKQITTGNVVIMGRKTYQSIPDKFRPLPKRYNIAVSKTLRPGPKLAICPTLKGALEIAKMYHKQRFIIGGASLYAEAFPLATELHVSHVDGKYNGDVFFPNIDRQTWAVQEEKRFSEFTYRRYTRK